MWDGIMDLISGIGTAAKSANELLDVVQKVKQTFGKSGQAPAPAAPPGTVPQMQSFTPQAANPLGAGNQFLPQLHQLAAQQGNAFVPPQSGYQGIDLTGIWIPPANPWEQSYVRQSGVYVNMITGLNLTAGAPPLAFTEGIFDPMHSVLHVVGRMVNGLPIEARAQIFPNWSLQGAVAQLNAFGMPMQLPLFLCRVA